MKKRFPLLDPGKDNSGSRKCLPANTVFPKATIALVLCVAVLGGCSVGPDYRRPEAIQSQPVPASFSNAEAGTNAPQWKTAQPSAFLPRGTWWEIFDDPELNHLETLAASENQDLAAAAARFAQARALVGVARADFFPQISADPTVIRQRTSVNAPESGKPTGASYTYNTYTVPLDMSWELDLWGRVRRQTEAARARFVASADDLESAKLTLQAEVASDYFTLIALKTEHTVVADTIETFQRALELTVNRRNGGIATDLDVSQAETQLRETEAQLPALDLQAADVLHALATLCGQPAGNFQVGEAGSTTNAIPSVPVGVPSELLERRPDIASAEHHMAAANAEVGVAKSAFYPSVVINGLAGFQSVSANTLFDWPSRAWAIGPTISLPLFTGGRNRANLALARATYDETVANYRQTVLAAFQEVEDQLAGEHLLAAQLQAENAALTAADRTVEIANNRYKAGLVTYLEVATAQNVALTSERQVVELRGQRLVTQVTLIKALGGGWESHSDGASTEKQTQASRP